MSKRFRHTNTMSPTVMQPLLGKGVDGKTTVQAPVAGKTAHANKAGLNVRRVVENG